MFFVLKTGTHHNTAGSHPSRTYSTWGPGSRVVCFSSIRFCAVFVKKCNTGIKRNSERARLTTRTERDRTTEWGTSGRTAAGRLHRHRTHFTCGVLFPLRKIFFFSPPNRYSLRRRARCKLVLHLRLSALNPCTYVYNITTCTYIGVCILLPLRYVLRRVYTAVLSRRRFRKKKKSPVRCIISSELIHSIHYPLCLFYAFWHLTCCGPRDERRHAVHRQRYFGSSITMCSADENRTERT